jgi:hypothetical protein
VEVIIVVEAFFFEEVGVSVEVIGSTETGTCVDIMVLVTVTVAGIDFEGGIGSSGDSDGIGFILRFSTPCAETKLNANTTKRINLRVV